MTDSYEVNKDAINKTILEQTNLLDENLEVSSSLLSNVHGFMTELSKLGQKKSKENEDNRKDYEEMLSSARQVFSYIEQVHIEIPALVDSMKESDAELKQYQEEIRSLTSELEMSNNLILELKEKETAMNTEATVQSSFATAMGSIMGTMLWKTSKTEEVIDTFINEGMIREFVIMSNVTINSFMESYTDDLPPLESHEFKFVMSVLGLSINISAQRTGRNFLLDDNNGLTFTNHIFEFLGVIKMPAGRLLKRMCLIFLFNLSICKRGAMMIQQSHKGVQNILKCLAAEHTSEIKSIVLTLMKSLLDEIPTRDFCQQVMKLTSREDLQSVMEDGDDNLKYLCTKFHDKIYELEKAPMEF